MNDRINESFFSGAYHGLDSAANKQQKEIDRQAQE
jgi:hypothetical protein